MMLYLDDDSVDRRLVAQLQRAGHSVVLPAEAGYVGASDAQHFTHAIRQAVPLLTRNYYVLNHWR